MSDFSIHAMASGGERDALISVVVPARNAADSVAALLRSLVPDTRLIGEILLVDDNSEDATAAIARDVALRLELPLRILPVKFGRAGAARNFGMAQARYPFLFFIDVDDLLVAGALGRLAALLLDHPAAGLAVGACIRQTPQRADKIKIPHGYTADRQRNVIRYLANELWPIAMGSALLVKAQAAAVRFPETIGLDEDTCFWAAVLTQVDVVTTTDPVLYYQLDEARMARRYATAPRATLLGLARAFRQLARYGVPAAALRQRTAWVALRITRQLILDRQYAAADRILRLVRRHPRWAQSWDLTRYLCRIRVGGWLQRLGWCAPLLGSPATARRGHDAGERRILFVTVDDAARPVSGADLRNHQNARSAARLGQVEVVSFRLADVSPAEFAGLTFTSVGVPGERARVAVSRPALERLLARVRSFQPDTVIVEGIPLAAVLSAVRPWVPCLVLDMHNLESDLAAQNRVTTRLGGKKAAARLWKRERQALQLVDQIWVCSAADRDRLLAAHAPAQPVTVVPNTIPRFEQLERTLATAPAAETDGPVLLFVGHLGYWPNEVAVERLVRGILPLVQKVYPTAQVLLAGRSPSEKVQALAAASRVKLHANPADLTEYYQRATLAVVPLSHGGGTRLKVLEAMAAGLPVVATPLAVDGLGLCPGDEVQLGETDAALARHIIDLCQQPAQRARQIQLALQTVRWRFAPAVVDRAIRSSLAGNP